ncbi:hypothetical protein [Bacillus manliponensis]|uniref:hypothetical protein n=1 Tax=Bacillus manliponensis TaxID=574376 RepID=UPI0035150F9C
MKHTNELIKILVDEKAVKIIELTKDVPKSTKELATLMNVKNSNLYYPIKKLLEINAIQIAHEKQVKNITEYYYSSSHLLNKEGIIIEGEQFKEHLEGCIKYYLYLQTKLIQKLEEDANRSHAEDDLGDAQISFHNVKITPKKWKELSEKINDLIDSYRGNEEVNGVETFNYIIGSYKE